jgi:uncharacterized LabA/DUF88 family protein
MSTSPERSSQAALFVDAENHPDLQVSALMKQLGPYNVLERHAYADWRNRCLGSLARSLTREGFEMHHVWSGFRLGAQKNTADGYMAWHIMQVLTRRSEIDTVIIVSGDAFFANLADNLHRGARRVIVAADPFRMSKELRDMADEYLPLGQLAHWIRGLDRLERSSRHLTFRFVTQELKIGSLDLTDMIHRGLIIQKSVWRPQRGNRNELSLNRQVYAVQAALVS